METKVVDSCIRFKTELDANYHHFLRLLFGSKS